MMPPLRKLNLNEVHEIFIFNQWVRCRPLEDREEKRFFSRESTGRTPKPLVGMLIFVESSSRRAFQLMVSPPSKENLLLEDTAGRGEGEVSLSSLREFPKEKQRGGGDETYGT